MRITRAETIDGRVFRAVEDGYHITYNPVLRAAALTPSPAHLVTPSSATTPPLARVLRPQAAYRWLLPQLASITPQYVEMVLRGALTGNHVQQWELFDLMFDTWPELASCAQELTYGVTRQKLIFEPYAEEGEVPTPMAVERCKLVSAALRRMAPDAAADENDLDGTLQDLIDGWFRGVTALEIDWQPVTSARRGTMLAPRSTFWVHPVCFAFDSNGRLGLRLNAQGQVASGMPMQGAQETVSPFPAHKFLIGIHKAKSGTALGGALLRPLAWWWCAANFSADWLLNLAQIFGLPFRWANYEPTAPQETVDRICSMLQNMGSAGWAAFPQGTTLEMKDIGKTGDHSPQGELLDRADRYARLLILGQTMSGGQDASKGGGKAFGEVEGGVKAQRIDAAARYVCRILNTQFIPSILALNYGDVDEAPKARLLVDKEGSMEEARRDLALAQGGLQVSKSYLRKKYGIPAPAAGEEIIGGAPERPGDDHPTENAASHADQGGNFDKAKLANHAHPPIEKDPGEPGKEIVATEEPAILARELLELLGGLDGAIQAGTTQRLLGRVVRWITAHGTRIPIREGEEVGAAMARHFAWLKQASRHEIKQVGKLGKIAQAEALAERREGLELSRASRLKEREIRQRSRDAERKSQNNQLTEIDERFWDQPTVPRERGPRHVAQPGPPTGGTGAGTAGGEWRPAPKVKHPAGSRARPPADASAVEKLPPAPRAVRRRLQKAEKHAEREARQAASEQGLRLTREEIFTQGRSGAQEYLNEARARGHLATTTYNRDRHFKEGGEHWIEKSADGTRVIKHTRNGLFGYMPTLSRGNLVVLRPARAHEYMRRMQIQNKLFGTDFRLEGSHALRGGGLTYSQKWIHGSMPHDKAVHDYMHQRGFRLVNPTFAPDIPGVWFHPEKNYLVADAKPMNFLIDQAREIHPLDLIIRRVTTGSALHRRLMEATGL